MEITTINSFLNYYEKTRKVTSSVVQVIPPDKVDWAYLPGKFTLGDMVRHIAAIERYVFAEVAVGNRPRYTGCGKELADGYLGIVAYFNAMHLQTIGILKTIRDESLHLKISSLDGKLIEVRHFLRALIVHEIHHRGALCIYLNLLGVSTPPIIGLMEEQVIKLSKTV